jgi:DNA-binding CsgD family transcriptional regulator
MKRRTFGCANIFKLTEINLIKKKIFYQANCAGEPIRTKIKNIKLKIHFTKVTK